MNIFLKVYYKLRIDFVWNTLASTITRITWKPFNIMSADETIKYILQHNCSVARFGDGELQIAAYGCSLKFQRADRELQHKLKQVMNSNNSNLLLCLPNRINITAQNERKLLTPYWQESLRQHLYAWTKNLPKDRCYGDTNMTRLTDGATINEKITQVQQIKMLWSHRNVIMVEGEKTRFGVGNDLFDDTLSVRRILGPAESAFDYYEQLLASCNNLAKSIENPLILLALGPTATVLAKDLSDLGIQAIDIGHFDISYEKLTRGTTGAIAGKYTNEAVGGNIVEDCLDENYLSEIALRIGI